MKTNLASLVIPATFILALSGCGGSTTDRVIERKVEIKENGSEKTKEKILHQNPDGSTTTIEKKTETKVKDGSDDTLIKLPGIEIKKN
ncbi:MAG: hypothetical protein WCT04_14280 [Planctomycetota bacterium]